MLPIILSLLGSGAAGAGLLGSVSPLIAGAIGSGLGTFIETGDLGKGIMSGLGGFLGGKALGGLLGSTALSSGAGADGGLAASLASKTGAGSGLGGLLGGMPAGTTPVVDAAMKPIWTGFPTAGIDEIAKAGLEGGILTGGGIGSALGGYVGGMAGNSGSDDRDDKKKKKHIPSVYTRETRLPTQNYMPGVDPEWSYFGPAQYSKVTRMNAGGLVGIDQAQSDPAPGVNDKDLLKETVMTIERGEENEEAALILGLFLRRFGEAALQHLIDAVATGEISSESLGERDGNRIQGAGDGLEDLIPAESTSGEDILLADGEYVLPKNVVDQMGGPAPLDDMVARMSA